MTFNKHFPDRVEAPEGRLSRVDRAVYLRMATWVSLLMLITGYVLMWFFWD
ncbi:MAG: hypothetical protein HYT80_00030 [Euryarchaeota archaeon]|nr:hypothetical protein [Euryarchaeota archaeon]